MNHHPVHEPSPCTWTITLYMNRHLVHEPSPCTWTINLSLREMSIITSLSEVHKSVKSSGPTLSFLTCTKLSLTFWHRSFTFNSNKSPTWCNNFSVYYPDVCLQLNMFREFSRPSSVAQWLQWQPLVLPSYRGDSRAVFVVGPTGRPAQPRTQHKFELYDYARTYKP
jgi:hypothetical protein